VYGLRQGHGAICNSAYILGKFQMKGSKEITLRTEVALSVSKN
jgi:hypothetical protein